MKVETGCTVLQSQILADAASAWFSRLLRWLLCLRWEDVDVSVPLLAIPGATAIVATLVLGP